MSNLDDFLSAPDNIRKSDAERAKTRQRKAKLEAEEQQLAAHKAENVPTIEDMLGDMVRVADDRDVNPYWRFRVLSRKRYRLYGWYPIEFIDREFGQFTHALEVAGLREQPGTRWQKAAITRKSRWDHAGRYVDRYILPHRNKHPELTDPLGELELVLSISDTHATYLDPFTWHCFLLACRDLKPGVVLFNGDILEGSSISSYSKIPGYVIPLSVEFAFAREMFRQVREVVGSDTRIVWMAGNHGLDRLAKYLTQVATAFADLPSMKFDKLAGVDQYDVEMAQGGWIASPDGTERSPEGILLHGFYRVYHGRKLGQSPALAELRAAGRSGQSGHVHRAGVSYGTTERDAGMSWMSTPMGCTPDAGRCYMRGITTGWQRGFGVAWLHPSGRVHQYPVITDGQVAVCEGYMYHREDSPMCVDITKNWIESFPAPE